MPVVNREVVLPVDRERAWELITEPAELEEWLGRRRRVRGRRGRAAARRRRRDREGVVEEVTELERIVFRWGDSRVEWAARGRIPAARASSSPSTATRADTVTWGPKLMALAQRLPPVPGVDEVFFALADPTRREVLRSLAQRPELTASRLAGELPITRQAVAKHLAALQRAGLVQPHREGRETRYTLTPAPLVDAMGWMADVGADWDQRLAVWRSGHAGRSRRHARRPRHRCRLRHRPAPRRNGSAPTVTTSSASTCATRSRRDLTTREGNAGAVSRRG